MEGLNIWAVIVAALSTFLIGGLWYSPAVLGKAWMRENGFTEESLKGANMAKIFGLAFFLGKPLIQPTAARLPAIPLGNFSDSPQVRSALQVNALFLLGILLAPALRWGLERTRWGLIVRTVGESAEAARALGHDVNRIRLLATTAGGVLAGIGGSFLSLFYPGSYNEGLSSGQGLMAVALVIFARWDPVRCLYASLLFGGATALGPALQSIGITSGYYLFNAAPYALTLVIMALSSSAKRTSIDQPAELVAAR